MKTIVTGCAGFIGSHLVEELLNWGHTVLGMDNLRTGKKSNMASFSDNDCFHFLEMDITDSQVQEQVNTDYDCLFHLAAISSVKLSIENPLEVHRVNTTGSIMMLELARTCNVDRIVFSSSAAVYGHPNTLPVSEDSPTKPLSPYAASKLSAENYMEAYQEAYGLETIILRYFNVFGPRQAYSEYSGVISIFLNQAIRGGPLTVQGDGKQTRSFIHVDNVVDATIKASEANRVSVEVLNISGSQRISILELEETIDTLLEEYNLEIVHQPPRSGDIRDSIGTMAKANDKIGFEVKKDLQEGLAETLLWYKTHSD